MQGRFAESEKCHRQALEIRRAVMSPDHPDVATGISNLGSVLYQQQRYAEAEKLYIEAVAIREKALGPEHPSVAFILNNLGTAVYSLGRNQEAEDHYRHAMNILELAGAAGHIDYAKSAENLATVFLQQGKARGARTSCCAHWQFAKRLSDRGMSPWPRVTTGWRTSTTGSDAKPRLSESFCRKRSHCGNQCWVRTHPRWPTTYSASEPCIPPNAARKLDSVLRRANRILKR